MAWHGRKGSLHAFLEPDLVTRVAAEEFGQSQFSHHLKRLLGVTPGQFRTRIRIA